MVRSVFGNTAVDQAYVSLCLISVVLGTISCFICVILMYRMKSKRKTGHMQLLLYMTLYQCFFEMMLFTVNVDVGDDLLKVVSYGIVLPCGMMSAAYSNWMVFVAWYIVCFKKPFYVLPNFNLITFICAIPTTLVLVSYWYCAFAPGANCIAIAINDIYDLLRTASIAINFAFILGISLRLGLFSKELTPNKTDKDIAIRTCVLRLIFYPIAQAISRVGYLWYHTVYGAYRDFDNLTTEKIACLMLIASTAGSISVAYLVIFLVMQPKAYDHFKALLRCDTYQENEEIDADMESNFARTESSDQRQSIEKREKEASHRYTTSGRPSQKFSDYNSNRDSMRFSFQDLRTDDEIMDVIETELDIGDSMFAPPPSFGGISMQMMDTPIRNILHQSPMNTTLPQEQQQPRILSETDNLDFDLQESELSVHK